jgi:hypothetical protein
LWEAPVSAQYPLADCAEDYVYVPRFGTLDEFNGRFRVTPDYPDDTLTPGESTAHSSMLHAADSPGLFSDESSPAKPANPLTSDPPPAS